MYIEQHPLHRKCAQGLIVLVSPIKYDEDEEKQEELEDFRLRYKRKIVGKVVGDRVFCFWFSSPSLQFSPYIYTILFSIITQDVPHHLTTPLTPPHPKEVAKGGHVQEFDITETNTRYTVVWYDDDKLKRQLEEFHYSMPLDANVKWEEVESSDSVRSGSSI